MDNPYEVINMPQAFDYYNSIIPESPFTNKKVIATHYYIKLQPKTIQHLQTLVRQTFGVQR